MDQLMNVILTIATVHTIQLWALDCRQDLGGLNQVYGTQPSHYLCLEYLWQVYKHLYQIYN